ncbi:MAG TPA: hypothetical protein VGO58_04445 [Chitinophagaceae bacterium]|jgi:hypothetical protein|nr:hypothetical protein [Chitinophagaceae bacterium]
MTELAYWKRYFVSSFRQAILLAVILLFSSQSFSQSRLDSLLGKLDPQKFASSVAQTAKKMEDKLVKKSMSVLDKMQSQEEKLYTKLLSTKDSVNAKERLVALKGHYAALKAKLISPHVASTVGQYIPDLDSLSTSLKFLDQNGIGGKVKDALAKTKGLQNQFQQAEQIKQFIRERKEQLKTSLEKLGMVKQLKKINKQVYYYATQVKEFKEILKDPKKIEKKALELLSKTKIFKDFMRRNSMLASLFSIPGNGGAANPVSLAGLQSRTQVNSILQQQLMSGGPNARQQIQRKCRRDGMEE